MINKVLVLLVTMCLFACNTNNKQYDTYASEHLKIEKISENLFKHISYLDTESYGKFPCNGIIYFNQNDVIVFDTPTNDKASAELINWIGEKNLKTVISTHFHVDCLGGLNEFHSNGFISYANELTIELAKANNKIVPQNGFDQELKIKIGDETVLTKYFGQGHTKDNVIGYIASEKALFGGCLIKELKAGKGNLEDANVTAWPITVSKIKRELKELELIVPGHGKTGGTELLDYTIDLFSEKQ